MKTLNLTTASNFVNDMRDLLATELNAPGIIFNEVTLTKFFNKLVNKEQTRGTIKFNLYGSDIDIEFWSSNGDYLNIKIIDTKMDLIKHIDFKITTEDKSVSNKIITKVQSVYQGLKFKSLLSNLKRCDNPKEAWDLLVGFIGDDTSSVSEFTRGAFKVRSELTFNISENKFHLSLDITKLDDEDFEIGFKVKFTRSNIHEFYLKVEDLLSKFH